MEQFYYLLDGTDVGFIAGVVGSSVVLLFTEFWS